MSLTSLQITTLVQNYRSLIKFYYLQLLLIMYNDVKVSLKCKKIKIYDIFTHANLPLWHRVLIQVVHDSVRVMCGRRHPRTVFAKCLLIYSKKCNFPYNHSILYSKSNHTHNVCWCSTTETAFPAREFLASRRYIFEFNMKTTSSSPTLAHTIRHVS